MVAFIVSCEDESTINENLDKINQKNVDPTGLNSDFNFKDYKESNSVLRKKSNVSSKIVDTETGLTFFFDALEFESNSCTNLSFEDFESSSLTGSSYNNHFFGALNSTTNNIFYSPGDIVENVNFIASLGGPLGDLAVVKDPYPSVFLRTGYTDNDFSIHFLNIEFTEDDVHFVSMDLLSHFNEIFPMEMDFYDDNGLIGSTTVPNISLAPTFFGVQSTTPIKRIALNLSGFAWEGIDNLSFGGCDSDGDGVNDNIDNCPDTPNPLQEDNDNDGLGDVCDDDDDNDGVLDVDDNCQYTPNPLQEDNDNDGLGDVCDDDDDNDGVLDVDDNCPYTPNPLQEDYDGDGLGDLCDDDDDNDGCLDVNDPIQFSNMETTINIDGCDYGVTNYMTLDCGITMSDLIDELENGEYKNHGQFVRAMAKLTGMWEDQGILTLEEKDLVMMCAGESSIGHK